MREKKSVLSSLLSVASLPEEGEKSRLAHGTRHLNDRSRAVWAIRLSEGILSLKNDQETAWSFSYIFSRGRERTFLERIHLKGHH